MMIGGHVADKEEAEEIERIVKSLVVASWARVLAHQKITKSRGRQ